MKKKIIVIIMLMFCLIPSFTRAYTEQDPYPYAGLSANEEATRNRACRQIDGSYYCLDGLECNADDFNEQCGNVSTGGSGNAASNPLYDECPLFVNPATGGTTELYKFLQEAFTLIKIASPALVVVLSLIDYLGAIAKSNDDEVKKANNRTVKRVIIGLFIFFLPYLLDIVFDVFGLVDVSRCQIGS